MRFLVLFAASIALFAQSAAPPPVLVPTDPIVAERNLRTRVAPEYPDAARQANVRGTVKLVVTIGPDGRVQEARAVQGPAMLRDAAMSAVRRWVYEPFVRGGQAVMVRTEVDVEFR